MLEYAWGINTIHTVLGVLKIDTPCSRRMEGRIWKLRGEGLYRSRIGFFVGRRREAERPVKQRSSVVGTVVVSMVRDQPGQKRRRVRTGSERRTVSGRLNAHVSGF